MKLDILVFAAHPDDAELSCSGTIASHISQGYKCGIVDLTRGEMGTRGNPELRMKEANVAAKILGIKARENLGFADIKFQNDWDHQIEIIKIIRKYQPAIILANAEKDRHPDHPKAAELVQQAFFKSGLTKIETVYDGEIQLPHRARKLYHFIQTDYIEPDFIVDISTFWQQKLDAIRAFKSQFHDPESEEPGTLISSPEFLDFIHARAKALGHRIGAKYGEGFTTSTTPGVKDLHNLF
ncbi:MAG: bacillithiol biosynthesis deacetylase BshB1 [Cyclobacteriaceae bacterium]|nr:bacillithiol biosynthesis deacetylase BshB1 [Cyclobacteriaceae bacterium]